MTSWTRTRTGTGTVKHAVRWAAARTRGYVSEHVDGTGEEHPDAVATDTADAFGTGVAVVQRPGALAASAVDGDFSAPERCRRGVREAVVLSRVHG